MEDELNLGDVIGDPCPQPEPGLTDSDFDDDLGGAEPCKESKPGEVGPDNPYNLPGPQVEFEAAYWLINPKLRVPTLEEVKNKLGHAPPYPKSEEVLTKEINELKGLEKVRHVDLLDDGKRPENVSPLSDFINLQPPPFGAIINASPNRPQYRIDAVKLQVSRNIRLSKVLVNTGRGLARMFENETPGLLHRHALNWLLYERADISPIRQARIWEALDLAIYAALSAAWHYKWAEGRDISFRQRPWEYDNDVSVLYDQEVNARGNGEGKPRECPCPTPGTPRHPAYPSGHSTYSAAASHILKYFFRRDDYAVEHLDRLADNVGEARIWAGVHWRSDHVFGQQLGVAVAETIIDQLKRDCVPILPVGTDIRTCKQNQGVKPPNDEALKQAEERRNNPCPDSENHDQVPARKEVERDDQFGVF